ncbi:unnamed protein product [Paramecium primaurelia]|uniref:Uncharacterized protein n=1 Tax=Paramecium primaurelia TaxID=5886 RepID=A0A8S1LJE7_PARPR|nr:unnamed protein product [Paramecium primaurelia]
MIIQQKNTFRHLIEQNQEIKKDNLVIKTTQDDNFQIYLNSYFEQFQLDTLISYTLGKFALSCKYMKSKLLKQNIGFPSAFKLDIKNDSITRMKMEHPIIASPNQRLILNPQFINQKYLFENLNYEDNCLYHDEFLEELLLTLLFWEILLKLQQRSQSDSYDIFIYPNRCNFYVVKNDLYPFFESNQTKMMNILLNTQTIQYINHELEIQKEYQIQFFDVHPPDEVINKGIIIQLKNSNEDEEKTQFSENQKTFEYFKYDQVTITPKPYYFIFSTLCEFDQNDELMHIIDFSPIEQPKCQKCKISIHPDDFESFYTKKGLLDVWEKGQLYLQQLAQFTSPNFLLEYQNFQIIRDIENQNLHAYFYQKKEKQKNSIPNQELVEFSNPLKQNANIQVIEEFFILYKKLQVSIPYKIQDIIVPDSQQQYQIKECLESDQEGD